MEALKKFAVYPVARDLDSLRAVVASVGAAFYQDFLYGPVEVLGLLWDDYTSCELPISNLAFKAHRHSPYADVLSPHPPSRTLQLSSSARTGPLFRVRSSGPFSITTCTPERSPAGLSGTSRYRSPFSIRMPPLPMLPGSLGGSASLHFRAT
jgi:hypothetical protein